MLTEQFVASVGVPTRSSGNNASKDVAILIQEFQPLNTRRQIFKKSASPPNCLAISNDHIFAAQAEKAVVNVYGREKGNQEATVPFTERITCITSACNGSVLILGTAEGRIFLWETASGRQVTTSQTHLQAVTGLAVDLSSNFLLSASADSTIHVWSIPSLLSFASAAFELPSAVRTFASHRATVNAIAIGHSAGFSNIAVSASADKTCYVWDYMTNTVLCTYLLPAVPLCLELDPADRAVYVGYEDGSVQQLDFYAATHHRGVSLSGIADPSNASVPIQPAPSSKWKHSDPAIGAAICISVSFDGCSVISGHQSGTILSWDIARKGSTNSLLQQPFDAPVTNISFLPVTGFANEQPPALRIPEVVKPRFGAFDSSTGAVPSNYAINVQFRPHIPSESEFMKALKATSFPTDMLDEGINELIHWNKTKSATEPNGGFGDEDFMALDGDDDAPRELSLEEQNASLKSELEALRRLQRASFQKIDKINAERKALIQREQKRAARLSSEGKSTLLNGHSNTPGIADELTSSSDEG